MKGGWGGYHSIEKIQNAPANPVLGEAFKENLVCSGGIHDIFSS